MFSLNDEVYRCFLTLPAVKCRPRLLIRYSDFSPPRVVHEAKHSFTMITSQWVTALPQTCFLSFSRYYYLLLPARARTQSSRELWRRGRSDRLLSAVRPDLRLFYFAHYKGISILLSFPPPTLCRFGKFAYLYSKGGKVMTAISFLFSPPLAVWVLRLAAPAKATGSGMRSEREQLIKSSSSRSTESQFCLPSTMISLYLKVMSYGTFASGNTMSSISMFHLLHKQGQVIPAGFYLGNQSNWLHSRGAGEAGRAK